jgi:Phage tail protein (Tail_P2_I)
VTLEIDSGDYIPEKLRSLEVYPKLQSMMNHVLVNALEEFKDVRFKYRGPDVVSGEAIQEIIRELGFSYISSVMQTITNYQFNTLLSFLALINQLKGSRDGLVLVLRLLGFDAVIQEWWQQSPPGEPYTFQIVILLDNSIVADPFLTLARLQQFIREYVFPVISNIDFKFTFAFASKNVTVAGFTKARYTGQIMAAI